MAVSETEGSVSWYNNSQSLVMLMVVLASALSLPYFRKVNDMFPSNHPAFVAIISGAVVALLAYPPMRFADRKYAFSNAILLGLLVAEFVVYGAPFDFPAPVAISFFYFMFFYGREEADHLWPNSYKGSL